MRVIVARLLVVLCGAACLWVVTPGSASASDCGSGFRAGAVSAPFDGVRKCNNYAGNGARVVGGAAIALAIALAVRAYRRGARATRTAYAPDGPPPPGQLPAGQLPAGQLPAAQLPDGRPGHPDRDGPVRPDEQSRLERFAASALAGELGAQPWTRAVLRVDATGPEPEASAQVHRPDGGVDAIPAPDESTSTLLELRESRSGPGPWLSATLTLTRTPSGQIDFTVDYTS